MAEDLFDGDFLLPSQFLTDDDIIPANQHINNKGSPEITSPRFNWEVSNGSGSCGSSSVLSSPVQSEMGSTGTESEEEDYIAELTRQMAFYMLQEDDKRDSKDTKSWGFPDSRPQRLTPGLEDAKNSNDWTQRNQPFTYDHLQAIQLYQLKQQQLMKQKGRVYRETREKIAQQVEPKQELQHMKNRGKACGGFVNGRSSRPLGLSSSSWPSLQQVQSQQTGSGMRAVFLKGSGSRSGSCGTGVFLPPGIVNSSESRKKPGCSTVLIPARVAQALKLHFDNMGSALSPYTAAAFPLQHDEASSMGGSRGLFSHQNHHNQNLPGMNHHDMGLPQEWTY